MFAPSWSSRCSSTASSTGSSTSRRSGSARSTRTTCGSCRQSPTRSAPRCARPPCTSGSSAPTSGRPRRSPQRSRPRTPTRPTTLARSLIQAEAVGRRLGLSGQELRDVRLGAVFHDIGKIAVPESILNKPGPLTPAEREVMERHTIVGRGDPRAGRVPRRRPQARAPRARALGRRRLPRRPRRRGDPARVADHPRLRRAARDDVGSPVPRRAARSTSRTRSFAATPARSSTRGWWERSSPRSAHRSSRA